MIVRDGSDAAESVDRGSGGAGGDLTGSGGAGVGGAGVGGAGVGGAPGAGGDVGIGGTVGAGGTVGTGGTVGSGGSGAGGGGAGGRGSGGSGSGGSGVGGTPGVGGDITGSGGGADAAADGDSDASAPTGITPTMAGQLVITEIMADTTVVADDNGEWFEVFNPGATDTLDLAGCILFDKDNNHTVGDHLLVRPGSFITLARFADATGGFVPDYDYNPTLCPVTCAAGGCPAGCPTVKFSNSGDEAGIACGPTVIDVVNFLVWPVPKGKSFSLDPRHYNAADNDLQGNWCTGGAPYHSLGMTIDYGSPGVTNPQCPF